MKSIQLKQGEDSVMVYTCHIKAIWHEIDHFGKWRIIDQHKGVTNRGREAIENAWSRVKTNTKLTDGSFSCVVKTQKRWSNKIYKNRTHKDKI